MSAAPLADPARIFVAIALTGPARAQIYSLLGRVRALVTQPGWKARVTADDDAHITLRFLGPVARSRLPALERALRDALGDAPTGRVSCGPIEVLPKHAWLRIDEGTSWLAAVAARVERACSAAGIAANDEDSHAFRPHLTLVRLDRAPDDAAAALLALGEGELSTIPIAEVTLFESLPRTRPGAAHYATLAHFSLRAQDLAAHGIAH
jgi:2'-5' RNA ligase